MTSDSQMYDAEQMMDSWSYRKELEAKREERRKKREEGIKMKYAVIKKPRKIEVCVCGTERGAINLINALEAQDIRENVFEPDTYYIEMRLEKKGCEKHDS